MTSRANCACEMRSEVAGARGDERVGVLEGEMERRTIDTQRAGFATERAGVGAFEMRKVAVGPRNEIGRHLTREMLNVNGAMGNAACTYNFRRPHEVGNLPLVVFSTKREL